jgi:hypothetical protein
MEEYSGYLTVLDGRILGIGISAEFMYFQIDDFLDHLSEC